VYGVAALVLFVGVTSPMTGSVAAQTSSGGLADVTLAVSVISISERDDATDVTVTATLREAAASTTGIALALDASPLLTPGVTRGAVAGADYTTTFDGDTIYIAAGSRTGSITFAVDPTFDSDIEGDEAIVVTGGAADPGVVVAPTDLIIEDGPYLSFPRLIYGALSHPGEPVSVTVEEAINAADADGAVTYSLTGPDLAGTPLALSFDPATRRLTGTAPAAAEVPDAGLVARWTVTARDGAGHEATTLVSMAVVPDVCGPTVTTWFHATDEPPEGLVEDCNVLLAARDTLRGTGTLNWSTDVPIATPWDGLSFHDNAMWIRRIELQDRRLDGTIPPVLGHLAGPASLDLVLGGDYRATDPTLENRLTGPIPPELGLPHRMVVLALSHNDLSGPIPRELANNANLHSLYLSYLGRPGSAEPSGLSGPIPPELGDLALRALNISGNPGVTGHVPWQLAKNVASGDHPGLQVLNLNGNSLEGNIPWQLGRFGKIQQLALDHNELTGGIPWQLGDLGAEESDVAHRAVNVYLNANSLAGPIPPELGDIANLTTLSLSENQLSGPIPAELGGLADLRYLFLRDNQLSGAIPPELGDLGNLTWMSLYGNRLDGEIPVELGRLSRLEVLDLACNDLSGTLPTSIGDIDTLTVLSVHQNPDLDKAGMPVNLERDDLTVTTTGECAATPTPSPSEPEPEPTATEPEPEPEPTATEPEPEPTATEPEPEPTATEPEPEPTATEPEPTTTTAAPEPTVPAATPETVVADREGGLPGWAIALVVAAAILAAIGGVAYGRRRR
jgi:Leucine-rich repeat (LRR) protein